MENNINEYSNTISKAIEFGNDIFHQNIDILRKYRKTIWDSVLNDTSAFLISCLDGVYEIKEDMDKYKQYTSNEIYEEFIKEYDMTMFLLKNALIKSTNENLLPASEEEQVKIKDLISKITAQQENNNLESVISALRLEDPSTRKTLEDLGLPKEKIEKIIASGYTVESVLDVETISNLKK